MKQKDFLEFTKQVWNLPVPNKADKAYGKHTAIMPKEMAERLILLFSFCDDIILDPFCGSGTTLEAAQRLGRKYVGYEIYKSYKKVINNKLDQTTLPLIMDKTDISCQSCGYILQPEFNFCPLCGKELEI